LENNQSAPIPHKTPCLSPSQCTTDFLPTLTNPVDVIPNWLSLFPVVSQVAEHFLQLPQRLLLINAQFWHTAQAVIESCYEGKQPLLTLQNFDQQKLFGRINLLGKEELTFIQGEICNLENGVLILHISPLLVEPKLWFLLKSFLLTQEIPTNAAVNSDKLRSIIPVQSDKKINTKIVIVANRYQLDELTQIDPDFSQVNSLFAELSSDIPNLHENILALREYCQQIITTNSLTCLTDAAFNVLFKHFSRLCEHQNKLLFSSQLIESTLRYAQLMHSQSVSKAPSIDALHIQQALEIQIASKSNAQAFSDQALVEKQIKIQLQGEMIGQINGLSVVELMGYPTEFGEIFRISASDMMGDGEIIDVERKVELAGNIHAKSTLIVQGYLNHFFTHVPNFPFSCNVVFEQSYQESDGDSASLAMLLAVTSCYSQTPIAQNLFVTGALDQHGNVLAIGGINQKIESISRLFALGLLTEAVTVLMPQANKINLMLGEETLNLISNKKINIYTLQYSLEAFPLAMSHSFESILEVINKRVLFLNKEDEEEPLSIMTKCLNLLR